MHHGGYELHLLCHALRQILHLATPPVGESQALEPPSQASFALALVQPFEACEEESLLAHTHLLVQAAFLGHVANMEYIVGCQRFAIEEYCAAVGKCYTVDDAYECGFAGTIRPQQAVDGSARYR